MVGGVAWPSCEPKIDLLMLSHLTFTNHVHLFDFFLKKNVNIWFLLNKKSWKGRKTFFVFLKETKKADTRELNRQMFSLLFGCVRAGGFPLIDRRWSRDLILAPHPLPFVGPFYWIAPFPPFFPPEKVDGTPKLMKEPEKKHIWFFFFCFINLRNFWQRCATWQRSVWRMCQNVATLEPAVEWPVPVLPHFGENVKTCWLWNGRIMEFSFFFNLFTAFVDVEMFVQKQLRPDKKFKKKKFHPPEF